MSYCSRPVKTSKTNFGTSATKTVNPPAQRTESCSPASSTVVSGGGSSTSTTVSVPGPAGPAGANGTSGTNGLNGLGFAWKGAFALNVQYKKQDGQTNPLADVVSYAGNSYICVQDNISITETNPEFEPGVSSAWQLVAQKGDSTGISTTQQTFIQQMQNDIFDWVKQATIGDLLLAGAAVAGVVWAGSKIISALSSSGTGDGNADSRFSGTAAYVTSAYTAPDIKDVVAALCNYGGIPYDVSALPDATCQFTIGQLTSIRTVLNTLSLAYLFDMVDTNGTLRFQPRQVTPVKTLTTTDIGFSSNPMPPTPYTGKKLQGISLPRQVTINYMDSSLDYNSYTQVAQLFTYPSGQEVSIDLPITMPAAQAKKTAEVTLINAHLEATSYSFTTALQHIDLEPGDVVDSPMGLIRITRIQEAEETVLQFDATNAGAELAVQGSNLLPSIPPTSTNIPVVIGYSQAFWIDPPNLNETDTTPRIYAAVHGYGVAGWPGAQIYRTKNSGATYELIATATTEATWGLVAAATASADYHVPDNTTSISVVLKTGSLASVSDTDWYNDKNLAMVGQELISFKTATLTAPKTYTLTGLLRGRQGTEQYVGTHAANEGFFLMDDSIVKIDLSDTERGQTFGYKVVTIGSDTSKVTSENVQVISNNLLMWTVYNGKVLKTGSDFTVSYKERVRFNNGMTQVAVNHDPDWGGFGIVVYTDNTYTTVKKTYTTTSEYWIYSAAMQVADFGATQTNLYVRVSQLSQKWGPGYPVTLNS